MLWESLPRVSAFIAAGDALRLFQIPGLDLVRQRGHVRFVMPWGSVCRIGPCSLFKLLQESDGANGAQCPGQGVHLSLLHIFVSPLIRFHSSTPIYNYNSLRLLHERLRLLPKESGFGRPFPIHSEFAKMALPL